MEKIVIEKCRDRLFNITQGNKSAVGLTYSELIGLISSLTMPEDNPCLLWMETDQQRAEWEKKYKNKKDDGK